jgi:hypothetical protein
MQWRHKYGETVGLVFKFRHEVVKCIVRNNIVTTHSFGRVVERDIGFAVKLSSLLPNCSFPDKDTNKLTVLLPAANWQ